MQADHPVELAYGEFTSGYLDSGFGVVRNASMKDEVLEQDRANSGANSGSCSGRCSGVRPDYEYTDSMLVESLL